MSVSRKVEVHKLTISGLPAATDYGSFLSGLRAAVVAAERIAFRLGERERMLNSAELLNGRLRLRFASYKPGFRPDVIDINALNVAPNPIGPDRTPVDWTHVLGGYKENRYVLLIECHQGSISPSQIRHYIQNFIDNIYQPGPGTLLNGSPVTVNLEPVPSSDFAHEIDRLDRITQASVQVVEPNPGWRDHQAELATLSLDSNARKAEVTLFAKWGKSLEFARGIVGLIKDQLTAQTLDGANVVGFNKKKEIHLSTKITVRARRLDFETDSSGQVDEREAWQLLASMMDEMD